MSAEIAEVGRNNLPFFYLEESNKKGDLAMQWKMRLS